MRKIIWNIIFIFTAVSLIFADIKNIDLENINFFFYHNPAFFNFLQCEQLGLSHINYYDNYFIENLSYSHTLFSFFYSINFTYSYISEFNAIENYEENGHYLIWNNMKLELLNGTKFYNIFTGLNLKIKRNNIQNCIEYNYLIDVGILYYYKKLYSLIGINGKDIDFKKSCIAGMSIVFDYFKFVILKFQLDYDISINDYYTFKNQIEILPGYNIAGLIGVTINPYYPQYITGIKIKNLFNKVSLSYILKYDFIFQSEHNILCNVKFGLRTKKKRKVANKITVIKFKNLTKNNELDFLEHTIQEEIKIHIKKNYSNYKIFSEKNISMFINFDTITPELCNLLYKFYNIKYLIKGNITEIENKIKINIYIYNIQNSAVKKADFFIGDINQNFFMEFNKFLSSFLKVLKN